MTASIQDIVQRIKSFFDDDIYYYTTLLIIVSLLSFGLGRMSVQDTVQRQQPQIVLTEQSTAVGHIPVTSTDKTTQEEVTKNFVASKKGTKYHLPTCPGAKQISEKNKIYFNTEEEAMALGYSRAKNCTF